MQGPDLGVIRDLVRLCDLGLVGHAVLSEELHLDGALLEHVVFEEEGVHCVAVAEDFFVVVGVRGAVGAVELGRPGD